MKRPLESLRMMLLLAACGPLAFVAPAAGRRDAPPVAQEQEGEVVRVRTDLVQTGVTVFDRQGRFVDGLRREQFELTVDGRPQPVSFFERVTAGSREEEAQLAAARGERAAPAARVERGRTVVFLVDDLHLSLGSLGQTRRMLARFIDEEMGPGDLVAVASTSGQVGFLQQFTDDKSVLRAAAARLVHRPYNVRDLSRESTAMSEYKALSIERRDDPGLLAFYIEECLKAAPPRYTRRACEVEVQNRARSILLQAASVVSDTYEALESLMRTSARLPGRKLVFFVSDGFLLDTGPRNTDPRVKLNRITDAARRAGAVVYTVDARGLISGLLDATSNGPLDMKGRLESANMREIAASQDALNALAEDTGGRALRNQNVFDPWVSKILEETSNYYLLAWRPDEATLAGGDFHNVKVSVVGRPDLTVRLPRGFMRAGPATPSAVKVKAQGAASKSPAQELREALGAFVPRHEVPTALSLVYLDTPGHGLVLTASTQVAEEALTFGETGGRRTAVVDVAGVVLNDRGKPAGSFQTRLNIDARAADTASPARSDTIYNYRQTLAPGLYQVRVAARDNGSGQVGSAVRWIEIPDLASRRLALSSLLVGVREVEAQEARDADAPRQVQFSVDHRFARTSRLSFMLFVYNAARGARADGRPGLTLQARILRGSRPVLTTPQREVAFEEKDSARIPFGGEVPLGSLPAGRYTLEVTVTDRAAATSATQRADITVE